MLVQSDVVQDPILSNVSVKYTNETYIADRILPTLRVSKETGKYYIYDKSNLRVDQTDRAAGSPSNEVGYSLSLSGVFTCSDHALKGFVADEVQDQAEAALNPLVDETEIITEKMMLDREVKAAALLLSTSNISQNTTLSGTSQWSDYSNSDPIGDIRTARTTIHAATFKKPNKMVIGKQVFDILVDHPQIIERVKYSQLGILTLDLLARLFQVDEVIVGEAGKNTANEGQTDALAYVWGKDALLAYVAPTVALKQVTFGYTFTYKNRTVKRWRDEDREGTYVRVGGDNYVQKLVAAACGYLLKAVVA